MKELPKEKKEELFEWISSKRALGKTVNYASVYKAGAAKIAQTAKITVDEAKSVLEAYWNLNSSVISVEEEQVVIECPKGSKWLINPINGLLYSLRTDKDKFSTLAQGTGSFMFDMWVDTFLTKLQDKWGKKTLTGSFHDELIATCRDNPKVIETIEKMLYNSIEEVSEKFMMRRELGCDVQKGNRYADIH